MRYEDSDALLEIKQGIVYVVYKKDVIITKSVTSRLITERIRLSNGISYPVILDARQVKYWTMDSRNNDMKGKAFDLIDFGALVCKSKVLKILWGFAIKMIPSPIEIKVFNEFEEAEEWVKLKMAERKNL